MHRHDRAEPLTPADVYEVDVEISPTSVTLPAGYALTLDVQGHDYVYPGAMGAGQYAGPPDRIRSVRSQRRPRPGSPTVYGGTVTLHTGGRNKSYLLPAARHSDLSPVPRTRLKG